LFIGASVMPFLYGMSPLSFLLTNDGTGHFQFDPSWLGQSKFDNPTQVRPGMVKDACWMDINKDQLNDLILVGVWMPVTVLIQQRDHRFLNETNKYGLGETSGWWNTVEAADFDGDGDEDLVAGNLGLNSRVKASPEKPLTMYLGDFDSNQGSDHIIVYYNGDKSYPFASRDQLVKQLPGLKKKFLHYSDYRDVKLEDIITPVQKGNSAIMTVKNLSSMYFRNDRDSLVAVELPLEAQFFPVMGMNCTDVDGDGFLDVLAVGNFSATQPDFGSYDAGVGLVLKGDGRGRFIAMNPRESGFVVRGEGRNVRRLSIVGQEPVYIVSRNNNSLIAFRKRKPILK